MGSWQLEVWEEQGRVHLCSSHVDNNSQVNWEVVEDSAVVAQQGMWNFIRSALAVIRKKIEHPVKYFRY